MAKTGTILMKRRVLGLVAMVLAGIASSAMLTPADAASRLKDIVEFEGVRDNMLVGYGLVVGLNLSLIHISEPTRQAEISYAVFCLKKKIIMEL